MCASVQFLPYLLWRLKAYGCTGPSSSPSVGQYDAARPAACLGRLGGCVCYKVLLVDDNVSIRQAVGRVFTAEADFDICGEAENGREAIQKAQELRPDL